MLNDTENEVEGADVTMPTSLNLGISTASKSRKRQHMNQQEVL
jgi:hypothetical protein